MNKTISVIIPVYNVEFYLRKCLDSVLRQTLAPLEIILVDDGSTDNSGRICDEYAEKEPGIRLLHQKNAGLSEARNAALRICRGDLVTFVDSDDYIGETYLQDLYEMMELTKTLISVTCGKKFYSDMDKTGKAEAGEKIVSVMDSGEALEDLFYRKNIPVYAWAKLYDRKLFEKIHFPPGELYEDLSTVYLLIHEAGRVSFMNVSNYYYRQRRDSIVGSRFNPDKMIQMEIMERIDEFIRESYPQIRMAVDSKTFILALNLYRSIPAGKRYEEEKILLKDIIKKYRWEVMTDSKNKKSARILAAGCYMPLGLARMAGCCYQYLTGKEIIRLKKPI